MNKDQTLKIPNHVAIILDGNGRWAQERGKKRTEGHKEGFERLKYISKYILNKGNYFMVYGTILSIISKEGTPG